MSLELVCKDHKEPVELEKLSSIGGDGGACGDSVTITKYVCPSCSQKYERYKSSLGLLGTDKLTKIEY